MKKLLLLLAAAALCFTACEPAGNGDDNITPPIENEGENNNVEGDVEVEQNNVIQYTTTDGKKLFPTSTEPQVFGAFLVANTYENGLGVLTFDDDVISIGKSAFGECTTLASITIPDSVTSIGVSAFEGCSSLASIIIPDSVASIGGSAFGDCSSLASVTIGNGVTSIGEYAFSRCSSLESINIPIGVMEIGSGVFYMCTQLTRIIVDKGNTKYDSRNNCNAIIVSATNHLKYGCKNSFIPEDITSIGEGAFKGLHLENLIIPINVYSIDYHAFQYCSGQVTINNNEEIQWLKASYINSVVFGDNRTSIPYEAFKNCNCLDSVTIPNSVTTIGNDAFENYRGDLIIDSSVIEEDFDDSGADWFRNTELYNVVIGDNVKRIGDNVFYSNVSVNSVIIGKGVTEIGDGAFGHLQSLKSVTIGNNVAKIGNHAFYSCDRLTSVIIPESVTWIGHKAFDCCSSLEKVYCKPITPPVINTYGGDYEAFDIYATLYVPTESVREYKFIWGRYSSAIVGYDFENGSVSEPTPDTTSGEIIYYDNFDKVIASKNGSYWPYMSAEYGNPTPNNQAGVTYDSYYITVRTTGSSSHTNSSNYADEASGNNNLFFGKTKNYMKICNISLEELTGNSLTLTFGTEKYSDSGNSVFDMDEFLVYISGDGQKWTPLSYSFPEGANTTGRWNVATAEFRLTEVPSNLYLYFTANVASVYRLDDVTLISGGDGEEINLSNSSIRFE